MITMRKFFELIDYRVNEGSDYGWQCYGAYAHAIDSVADCAEMSMIFDRRTQTVYEVTVHDYRNDRSYRMIHPDYQTAHAAEATKRGVAADQAWDSVKFVELDADDDFVQKAQSILAGEDYDTRISIPIELPDSELLSLFKIAHERDIKFNDFVTEILEQHVASTQQEIKDHGVAQMRCKNSLAE